MFRINNDSHAISSTTLEQNFCSLYSDMSYTRPTTRPNASSSLCPRQIALGMHVPARPVKQLKTLSDYASIGNTIEEGVLAKYRKHNQLYLSQFRIPTELTTLGLDIGGIVDAFLLINGHLLLVDIKSVGSVESQAHIPLVSEEVAALSQGGTITIAASDDRIKQTVEKGVKESHIAQLQTYAAVTGFDDVYIQLMSRKVQDTYNNDGNPSVKFEQIPVSTALLEKRVAIIYYSQLCLQEGFVPDKLSGIKKTGCKDAFCNFVDYCWEQKVIDMSLKVIEPEKSTQLKLKSLELAKDYISKRPERKELTLNLIEQERERRLKKNIDL